MDFVTTLLMTFKNLLWTIENCTSKQKFVWFFTALVHEKLLQSNVLVCKSFDVNRRFSDREILNTYETA